MRQALGILEISNLSPAIMAIDWIEKAADVRIVQAELNDASGVVLKVAGDSAALRAAVAAGREAAESMRAKVVSAILDSVDDEAFKAIDAKLEKSALTGSPTVFNPPANNDSHTATDGGQQQERTMSEPYAIGLIETQGFTAVFEAIDTACKAANVEILGKEKLGGGYITVLLKGDVAAVKTAVEAGRSRIEDLSLGKVIASHVIPKPSASILGLFGKV